KAMSWVGLIWDIKTPPVHVLRNEQKLGVRIVDRAAEQLAAHFNSERIAQAIAATLHGPALSNLQESLARASERTTEVLSNLHLPQMPSRDEVLAQAKAMFARTISLDEIVDRAYELVLASVGTRLAPISVPAAALR
ncbi:MAG TPA: acyl-CoA desaturase, partial [Dongiaceae bacterium]|nr:acyl-CoA desaturase [Dongiaceae bacterium]